MSDNLLYLDDVKIGDRFESREILLTKDHIIEFASKYGPQTFHIDEEKAKDTFFKGLCGSGWQTAAMTMSLLVESVPFAHGMIGLGLELEFVRPSRPNDIFRTVSEVKDIKYSRSKPNQGIIFLETTTLNQNDEPVITIKSKQLNFVRGFEV